MKRNVLGQCGGAQWWILSGAVVLALASWLRYGALEAGFFPVDCGPTLAQSPGAMCLTKWVLVQSFLEQRLGLVSLVLGLAAFVLRRRPVAWGGWLTGIAGLVLYNFDYAAVGAMLSLLVLAARPHDKGQGEAQAHG